MLKLREIFRLKQSLNLQEILPNHSVASVAFYVSTIRIISNYETKRGKECRVIGVTGTNAKFGPETTTISSFLHLNFGVCSSFGLDVAQHQMRPLIISRVKN